MNLHNMVEGMVHKKEIFDFLSAHPFCVLSTFTDDKKIHSTAMFGIAEENFTVILTSKTSTQKFDHIASNPDITLLFFDQINLVSVEIQGVAEFIIDVPEASEVLLTIQKRLVGMDGKQWTPPAAQIDGHQYAMIRVRPSRLLYRAYRSETHNGQMVEYELPFIDND